jgi:hypothetical protein
MNRFIHLTLPLSLTLSTLSHASNPIQGFYGGVIAGISHGPAHYDYIDTVTLFSATAPSTPIRSGTYSSIVNNSLIGAGGGGHIGYRLNSFRLEAEGFYNYTSAGTVSLIDCTLESPAVLTPTGDCTNYPLLKENGVGFNGSTGAFYGLFNVYYDFVGLADEQADHSIIPYIGLGIGAARIRHSRNFVDTIDPQTSIGISEAASAGAFQGILGVSFFLDDYAWIGVDLRYLRTSNLSDTPNKNTSKGTFSGGIVEIKNVQSFSNLTYGLGFINISVNASFDNGSTNF